MFGWRTIHGLSKSDVVIGAGEKFAKRNLRWRQLIFCNVRQRARTIYTIKPFAAGNSSVRFEQQSGEEPNLMQITKQLALFLENRPGTLARVCEALADAKINIYAISTSDTVDHSVVRMVLSDYRKALTLFEAHGTLVVEDDVLMVESDNKPGSLAKIAHKLSGAKVNIEYAYCATPPDAKKGLLILRLSDAKKALKALNT
jgi:hypothetical protein